DSARTGPCPTPGRRARPEVRRRCRPSPLRRPADTAWPSSGSGARAGAPPAARSRWTARAPRRPWPPPSAELLQDKRSKVLTAFLEVAVLVVAGAGRREKDGFPRAGFGARLHHRALEITAPAHGHASGLQRSGELVRRLADEIHGRAAPRHQRRQGREILLLSAPAGDQVNPARVGLERDDRAGHVGGLGVVHI